MESALPVSYPEFQASGGTRCSDADPERRSHPGGIKGKERETSRPSAASASDADERRLVAGNAAGGPEKQLKRDPHNPEERGSLMLPSAAGPPPLAPGAEEGKAGGRRRAGPRGSCTPVLSVAPPPRRVPPPVSLTHLPPPFSLPHRDKSKRKPRGTRQTARSPNRTGPDQSPSPAGRGFPGRFVVGPQQRRW